MGQGLVLFGGYDEGTLYHDLWRWDGATWTHETPSATPPFGSPTASPSSTPVQSPTVSPTLTASPTASATPAPNVALCGQGLVINGALTEPAWSGAWQFPAKLSLGANPTGVTAKFQVLWDATNVYIGAVVNDNALFNNQAQIWNNDAVEIFLDMNHNRSTTYQADDFQYIFGWNNPTAFEQNNRLAGVNFATASVAGGWSLEAAIPWATLGVTAAQGSLYGFDLAVDFNQDGTGRQGQLVWHGTQLDYQDTSQFGDLTLGPACGSSPTPSPTRTASPSMTKTATPSPTTTPTATPTASPTGTRTASPIPTATATPSRTPTSTSTRSPSATLTLNPSASPSAAPSQSPTGSRTATAAPSATNTVLPSASASPAPSQSPTGTRTATPVPSATATGLPSSTATPSPSQSPTGTRTATPPSSATATGLSSSTATPVPSQSPTGTRTASPVPSATATSLPIPTVTMTPSQSPTQVPTTTPSPSVPGGGMVLEALPVPNPWVQGQGSLQLAVELEGSLQELQVRIYTTSMIMAWQSTLQGRFGPGWNRVTLAGLHLSPGLYFGTVNSVPPLAPARFKLLVLP